MILLDDLNHKEIDIDRAIYLLQKAKEQGHTHLYLGYEPVGHETAVVIKTKKQGETG